MSFGGGGGGPFPFKHSQDPIVQQFSLTIFKNDVSSFVLSIYPSFDCKPNFRTSKTKIVSKRPKLCIKDFI